MKILVPVEDILFAAAIVNFIAQHQWPAAAQFVVLTVVEPFVIDEYPAAPFEQMMAPSTDALEADAQSMVNDVAQSIKQALPGVTVSSRVITGHVKDAIVAAALDSHADLIVAGSHGRSGFNRFVLGSVSLALLTGSPCPVILVRPDAKTARIWERVSPAALPKDALVDILAEIYVEKAPRKIMVAVDETELSNSLIDMVGKHEWIPPAIFRLVSVVRRPVWLGRLTRPGYQEIYQELMHKRTKLLARLAERLSLSLNSPNVEEDLREGDPKQILIEMAQQWDADLLVVGSHAPFNGPKLGSVALAMLCAAPCPVLMLRQSHGVSDASDLKSAATVS